MNSSGKILTVFFVIIAVLLLSLTAASMFFFQKEIDKRRTKEQLLAKAEVAVDKKSKEISELKKQTAILSSKNKELDDVVESLTSDLELEKGLKQEIKIENAKLKDDLKKEVSAKEKALSDLETKEASRKKFEKELQQSRKTLADIESSLAQEKEISSRLSKENIALKGKGVELQKTIAEFKEAGTISLDSFSGESTEDFSEDTIIEEKGANLDRDEKVEKSVKKESKLAKGVELDPIIVTADSEIMPITTIPNEIPEGRILSVDEETDFVIVNLGAKDNVKVGYVLSVYRGKKYLGDIKVTRVQPEMFAADIIPPMSSKIVRKNDQVVVSK